MLFVPVIDRSGEPLMPTTPARARRWIKSGKATPFWNKGIFCVRLNEEPSARNRQPIFVGVDPGSKKEGFSVVSASHIYLNVQADAVTWVSDAVKTRADMRRGRRFRKTPCRQPRSNRARGGLPPSTRARWGLKLRVCQWLTQIFPVAGFVVEEVAARTKGQRRWDSAFSPLEVGKRQFYAELSKIAPVQTRQGWETKELREARGLKKSGKKRAEVFEAHCVDAYVVAADAVGNPAPDNTSLLCLTPIHLHRRQLHALQPVKEGLRRSYGGTRSAGLKRGSVVKHPKYGVVYVGGTMKGRVSLHSLSDGERLCRNAKVQECKFLTYSSWRVIFPTIP